MTDEPATESAPGHGKRRTGIALLIGGGALAATGGLFASLSKSISDDLTDVEMGERFDPALENRAKTFQSTAIALWAVGAVAVLGGSTLYVTGRRQARRKELSVAPAPLRGGAAAMVTWRW